MTIDINKIEVGDPLIAKTGDSETFKTYAFKEHYPGYHSDMQEYNGTVGIIENINSQNNYIVLSFADGESWVYLPEWVGYFKDGIQELEPHEPECKFKIGDTVFIKNVGGEDDEGYGKVIYVYGNHAISVRHYMSDKGFHSCKGKCPNFYGWNYTSAELELAELP